MLWCSEHSQHLKNSRDFHSDDRENIWLIFRKCCFLDLLPDHRSWRSQKPGSGEGPSPLSPPPSFWGSLTDARLTVPVPKHARVERMNGLSTSSFHASAPSMLYPKSINYPNISSGSMGQLPGGYWAESTAINPRTLARIPNPSTCLHSKDLHNHHHPAFLQIFEKTRLSAALNTPLLLAVGQIGFQIRNPSLRSKRFCAVLGAKNEERETKTKRKMDLVPFSRGQNENLVPLRSFFLFAPKPHGNACYAS